ncbi:type II toxin-antitoxin system antitoxin SocA domain-containing protein [Phocaeicola sp.]|jgi:uncharacterized phage-associated protein|uniref:Panacea domain-containing protein n=1 Tax=Phocaeicola sp. TaxID=2773926 RepID=UPI00307C4259
MENVVKIASYICQRYQRQFGKRIDEMKLHKLLYFTQRESIIQTGKPIFEERFEAWKYGPVLLSIRQLYKEDALHEPLPDSAEAQYKPVFDKVFDTYARKDSWSLSSITHGEYAWRQARQKVDIDGKSHELMQTDDIRKDAERVKQRRFLYNKVAPFIYQTDNYANH